MNLRSSSFSLVRILLSFLRWATSALRTCTSSCDSEALLWSKCCACCWRKSTHCDTESSWSSTSLHWCQPNIILKNMKAHSELSQSNFDVCLITTGVPRMSPYSLKGRANRFCIGLEDNEEEEDLVLFMVVVIRRQAARHIHI